MSDELCKYYENQAGSGFSGYQGVRFQKGHNIFGRALKFFLPVLKFFGKHLLEKGISVASDVLEHDKPLKESIIKRGKEGLKNASMDGLELLRQAQIGKGRKIKKTSKKRKPVKRKRVVFILPKVRKRTAGRRKTKRRKKSKSLQAKIFNNV
jgi:hypothetical protein